MGMQAHVKYWTVGCEKSETKNIKYRTKSVESTYCTLCSVQYCCYGVILCGKQGHKGIGRKDTGTFRVKRKSIVGNDANFFLG